MFLRRCRFPPFTFRETNDSQFLLKVVIGPDLDRMQLLAEQEQTFY